MIESRTGCLFGAQSFSRAVFGSVRGFRGFVGGMTDVCGDWGLRE